MLLLFIGRETFPQQLYSWLTVCVPQVLEVAVTTAWAWRTVPSPFIPPAQCTPSLRPWPAPISTAHSPSTQKRHLPLCWLAPMPDRHFCLHSRCTLAWCVALPCTTCRAPRSLTSITWVPISSDSSSSSRSQSTEDVNNRAVQQKSPRTAHTNTTSRAGTITTHKTTR